MNINFDNIHPNVNQQNFVEKEDATPQASNISDLALKALDNKEDAEFQGLPNLKERLLQICPPDLQPHESDPFYGTDLIVYRDDFKGPLALNGIKKSEFEQIKKIYRDSLEGNSIFNLEALNSANRDQFLLDLKMLLTRQKGRDLILKLIDDLKSLKLNITADPNLPAQFEEDTINMNYINSSKGLTINPKTGYKQVTEIPSYLVFGHELIHVLHKLADKNGFLKRNLDSPNLSLDPHQQPVDKNFDNLEEQLTITGFTQPITMEKDDKSIDDWQPWLEEYKIPHYQSLSENALRAHFRFKFRADHLGLAGFKDNFFFDNDALNSKEGRQYLLQLIEHEALEDLNEFFKEANDINQPILFDEIGIMTPLELTIYLGKLKLAQFLINKGGDIKRINKEGQNLCHLACLGAKKGYQSFDLLPWLVSQGLDPILQDQAGNTPTHLGITEESIKYFSRIGFNFKLENTKGESIYDLIFQDYFTFRAFFSRLNSEEKTNLSNYYLNRDLPISEDYRMLQKILPHATQVSETAITRYIFKVFELALNTQELSEIITLICKLHEKLKTQEFNIVNEKGIPLLHYGISLKGPKNIKQVLIGDLFGTFEVYAIRGASSKKINIDPSIRDSNGNTVFHAICQSIEKKDDLQNLFSFNSIKFILDNINEKNKDGKTPIQIAKELNKDFIIEWVKAKASPEMLEKIEKAL